MELKLHYTAALKKKKKNTIPIRCKQGNVYNHIPSEIHTSFQTFSPADSV